MKPKSIKSLLALALLAPGALFAQTTAKTTPVGYTDVAVGGVPANSDVILSVPLDRETLYSSTVSSVSGADQIVVAGSPAFAAAQFTTEPCVVKLTSGAKDGFYALITSHTADTLTISLPPGQTLGSVVSGDKLAISKAWTAKAYFAGAALPADVELYQYSGIAPGINLAADFTYVWDGTDWIDGGSGSTVDPILYPGESFVLRNATATAIDEIIVSGQVPVSKFSNVLGNFATGQQDLPLALFSPVDQTLTASGLLSVAVADDEIYFFDNDAAGINKSAATTLVFDGTDFLDAGSGNAVDANAFMLKSGEGFTYRRAAGSTTVLHNFSPGYVPSL